MADNGSIPSQRRDSVGTDQPVETYVKYAIEIEDQGVGISEEN